MPNQHWNAVQKMIEGFLELYPEAEYEFAHVVLSDYNLEDQWIERCLKEADEIYRNGVDQWDNLERIKATEYFLRFLSTIPEEKRMPTREE